MSKVRTIHSVDFVELLNMADSISFITLGKDVMDFECGIAFDITSFHHFFLVICQIRTYFRLLCFFYLCQQ